MEELLYIWAKEHSDFKYQQGMNDILAVVVICLVSELATKQSLEKGENGMNSDDEDSDDTTLTPKQLLLTLHDPEYLWADAYLIFENIMNLGVKELYYRQTKPA